ncbi:hypothetical protein [Gracilibacillus thailandensis]|jgi:hypothetical protein|uniref:Uncharacterized protein n=1 Tax=Gracilibacillus thailandensis TaxID=563735 RepID=A0A6N7QUG0_9BACI|nr:hypothetical protein [Gracilibacillus thailandensis]MRI65757.1 hypothetical protein [Gracilibacillus thailandensis]
MVDDERDVSKLYRKIITSNEMKAFLIIEKCDEELKQRLMSKMENNGSQNTKDMLQKLQRYLA